MKYIHLTAVALYLSILSSFAQTKKSDSTYKSRKITIEEANFVSGYYHQDGNHSAVTGGVGTENLTDFATNFDITLLKYDKKNRKHTLRGHLGVDTYTSASSDMIDLTANSSASSSDVRIYPSLMWNVQNEKKGTTFGLDASFSKEHDYQSFGFGANFVKTSADKNREFGAKFHMFLDTWEVILPIELRPIPIGNQKQKQDFAPRNSVDLSLSYSQVINTRLQALLLLEPAYQYGQLDTKFQRVYFTNGVVASENLPTKRFKVPIGLRLNYFLGDRMIIRSLLRYYQDSWDIKAGTLDLEVPIKITPFFSLSPFYRYYQQTASRYFAPYGIHQAADTYFTSDYDISKFDSHFYGVGLRLAPPKGLFTKHLHSLELRYGHYERSTDLSSNIISLAMKFKP